MRRRSVAVQGEQCSGVIFVGKTAGSLVSTDVVPAAFEQRDTHWAGQVSLQRGEKSGQIAIDDLPLESKRGGRHYRGRVALHCMGYEGKKIGERLTRPGSRLYQQVGTAGDRLLDLPHHLMLSAALLSAHCFHDGIEQLEGTYLPLSHV